MAEIVRKDEEEATDRIGPLGTLLLPRDLPSRRKYPELSMDLGSAYMLHLANSSFMSTREGPYHQEDPRVRVYATRSKPSVVMIELNSTTTFNMMDPELSSELNFAMDNVKFMYKRSTFLPDVEYRSYAVQGSGPHFCPGGNPNPQLPPGHTAFSTNQWNGYLPFVRIRESGVPGVVCGHGSQVGGGVAYALNCHVRVAATTNSICFGNASRGAVPGMWLSKNVCQVIGFSPAVDLYLTDNTLSTYALVQCNFLTGVFPAVQGAKLRACLLSQTIAASPFWSNVCKISPPCNMHQFVSEAIGIMLSAKSGQMFANLSAKRPVSSKSAAAEQSEETGRKGRRGRTRGARKAQERVIEPPKGDYQPRKLCYATHGQHKALGYEPPFDLKVMGHTSLASGISHFVGEEKKTVIHIIGAGPADIEQDYSPLGSGVQIVLVGPALMQSGVIQGIKHFKGRYAEFVGSAEYTQADVAVLSCPSLLSRYYEWIPCLHHLGSAKVKTWCFGFDAGADPSGGIPAEALAEESILRELGLNVTQKTAKSPYPGASQGGTAMNRWSYCIGFCGFTGGLAPTLQGWAEAAHRQLHPRQWG